MEPTTALDGFIQCGICGSASPQPRTEDALQNILNFALKGYEIDDPADLPDMFIGLTVNINDE